MSDGWLPEGFELKDSDAPARMARRVHQRVAVHRRRVRLLQGVTALAALAVILGLAPLLWHSAVAPPPPSQVAHFDATHSPAWTPETSPTGPPAATIARRGGPPRPPVAGQVPAQGPAQGLSQGLTPSKNDAGRAGSPSPTDHGDSGRPDISIQKAGSGVELAWTGNPQNEYAVYRCTSPKFDRCSLAGVVKGTKWVDRGGDAAPVVYYRVERKA